MLRGAPWAVSALALRIDHLLKEMRMTSLAERRVPTLVLILMALAGIVVSVFIGRLTGTR